jgi:hypothetical protein
VSGSLEDLPEAWADAVAQYQSQVSAVLFETNAARQEARALRSLGATEQWTNLTP